MEHNLILETSKAITGYSISKRNHTILPIQDQNYIEGYGVMNSPCLHPIFLRPLFPNYYSWGGEMKGSQHFTISSLFYFTKASRRCLPGILSTSIIMSHWVTWQVASKEKLATYLDTTQLWAEMYWKNFCWYVFPPLQSPARPSPFLIFLLPISPFTKFDSLGLGGE